MQVNNRLFEIVYILLQKKKTTAKELADRFEVSTRTIYRDIETLSTANIPIYASKGKDGGIGLLDKYILNKTILSEEEQNQILFALQGMKKVKGQDEKDILEKLSILFNKEINDWIKIDFSSWGNDKEESKRMVEPLQIWFKDKSWYLISYCRNKEDYRIFKIARIKEVKMLQEHFERELPKEENEQYNFKIIELELEINKAMTYRVYDEFESKEITKKQDGNFIIKVKYPENEWVYGYILSFGEYAKVLNPGYAKNIIKDKLQRTLKNYL